MFLKNKCVWVDWWVGVSLIDARPCVLNSYPVEKSKEKIQQ